MLDRLKNNLCAPPLNPGAPGMNPVKSTDGICNCSAIGLG